MCPPHSITESPRCTPEMKLQLSGRGLEKGESHKAPFQEGGHMMFEAITHLQRLQCEMVERVGGAVSITSSEKHGLLVYASSALEFEF